MDILILTPQKLILEEHAKQYLKASCDFLQVSLYHDATIQNSSVVGISSSLSQRAMDKCKCPITVKVS
jgi:hypothetical protein